MKTLLILGLLVLTTSCITKKSFLQRSQDAILDCTARFLELGVDALASNKLCKDTLGRNVKSGKK